DPIEHFLDRDALGLAGSLAGDVLQADRRVGVRPHFERGGAGPRGGTRAAAEVARDLDVHVTRAAQTDHALDRVFELTDVARPLVLDESLQRLAGHVDRTAVLGV